MSFSEKFESLHNGEEFIRKTSIETVEKSDDLQMHVRTIEAALDLIDHFARGYATVEQDELVIQLLGIRLFNTAGATTNLLLAGYYQNSVMQMRDMLETWFLLDYFDLDASNITKWRTLDATKRRKEFSPVEIRKALDIRSGFSGKKRAEHYQMLSAYGAHPSPESFRLYRPEPNGLAQIGPFFNKTTLEALLHELAKLLAAAAMTFGKFLEVRGRADQLSRLDWLDAHGRWTARFAGMTYEPAVIAEFRAKVMKWPEVLPKLPKGD